MGVSTGNGSNGFESRGLENAFVAEYNVLSSSTVVGEIEAGDIILNDLGDYGVKNAFYIANFSFPSHAPSILGYSSTSNFTYLGLLGSYESSVINTTPSHNTIALDSSGDKAVKYFLALGKDSDNNAYGVVASKEIDFDVDSGDTGLFEQLIDGTDLDDNGNTIKTDISYIPLNYKMEN